MKKHSALFASLGLTALMSLACNSSSIDKYLKEGKALVRVGDTKINEGYLNLLQKVNPGIRTQIENPQAKKKILENLIEQEMLYQESVARKIDKLPQVQEKVDLYKRVIVAQSLLEQELEKKAADYYEKNKEKEFETVKVSHIFFSVQGETPGLTPGKVPPPPPSEEEKKKNSEEAEAKAKNTYGRLKGGEDWDKVTKETSEDKLSAERGGDFGTLGRADRRIERLEYQALVDKAFQMKKGEVSEPIKAKDGWHILKVTEEKSVQPFEEAINTIKFKLKGEVKSLVMADLKKKMKVEYLDVSLADSPATTPAAPAPLPIPAPAPAAPDNAVKH